MYSLRRTPPYNSEPKTNECAAVGPCMPPPLKECMSSFTRNLLHMLSSHRAKAIVNGIRGSAMINAVYESEKEETN